MIFKPLFPDQGKLFDVTQFSIKLIISGMVVIPEIADWPVPLQKFPGVQPKQSDKLDFSDSGL